MYHSGLKLGELNQRGLDAFLDGADLGGDFVGGVVHNLFAHDCSFPGAARRSGCRSDPIVGWLAVKQPCEAFEPGEIHARRERRSDRDDRNPEQPLTDAHLIPGVAPGCERQLQGRSESDGPLLGPETGPFVLPCTVSVPNLKSDRPVGLVAGLVAANVRRLLYQALIWAAVLRHQAGGLGSPLDAEDVERAADALVDRVRRDGELDGDLFGRMMGIDQPQAIELASA